MKVYLDNEQLDVSPGSVADALLAGRDAAEAGGRLVIEVHVDGEPMNPDWLDSPPTDDAGVGEMKLISTRPGPFLKMTLLDAVDMLEQIRRTQAEAVERFQTGHIEDGVPPLQNALGSWTLIRDVVEKIASLGSFDPSTVVVTTPDGSTRTGASYIDGLAHGFDAVRRALEVQDFTALADVIEGDLETQAADWSAYLKAMAEQLCPEESV